MNYVLPPNHRPTYFIEKNVSAVTPNTNSASNPLHVPAGDPLGVDGISVTVTGTVGTASGVSLSSVQSFPIYIPYNYPVPGVVVEAINTGKNKFEQAAEISKSKA